MRGYVQVYTGDGKGKTTAALGLALRAAGAGLKVFIAQFVKRTASSELEALRRFSDLIAVKQFGRGRFVWGKPSQADVDAARKGLSEVRTIVSSGEYQVVILDEANVATHLGLIPLDELLAVIDAKPEDVELVITGRDADPRVIERADLATEMVEVKHYYDKGVEARTGIEK
ncbi:MAG: cob(I)yrinic acid a,c-diamide adenosyltransferase [Candidatus Coatesbacteria bacterium]|nr:cob(I)yrinic acid a,c-diamide adenosyltransferase [Candidatus Coatesbacteria bacterium]